MYLILFKNVCRASKVSTVGVLQQSEKRKPSYKRKPSKRGPSFKVTVTDPTDCNDQNGYLSDTNDKDTGRFREELGVSFGE